MEPFKGLGTEILLSRRSVLLEMSWEGVFFFFKFRNQTTSFHSILGRPMKTLLWHLPPDSHSPQHFSRVAHIEPAKMLKLSQLLAHSYLPWAMFLWPRITAECSLGIMPCWSPQKGSFSHTQIFTHFIVSHPFFPPLFFTQWRWVKRSIEKGTEEMKWW